MKIIILFVMLGVSLPVVHAADTFAGVITETMCGAKPHIMFKGRTPAECINLCVARGPNVYALSDGTHVMKLSDQKTATKYPAQNVKVSGTYDEKTNTIRVASIEPVDGK
jgi:hypothetical protein